MNTATRTLLVWIVIFGVVVLLWQTMWSVRSHDRTELAFSDFITVVEEGRVETVTIRGQELTGRFKEGDPERARELYTQVPDYPDLVPRLLEAGVHITAERGADPPLLAIFLTWGPVVLIVGLWLIFMRAFRK